MSETISFDAAGRAVSARFGDFYEPTSDGGQAREVFLRGNGLPERWHAREAPFRLLELGFGTGRNFLETRRAWLGAGAPCDLEYVGIEGHPLTRAERAAIEARRAAAIESYSAASIEAHRGEESDLAPDVAALLAAWPPEGAATHTVRGVEASGHTWTLTLLLAEFAAGLAALAPPFDAVYLDGFSPARNPTAWRAEVFAELARLVRPGGTAATWSVAAVVRAGFASAGFDVARRPGFDRKLERLEATKRSRWPPDARFPVVRART